MRVRNSVGARGSERYRRTPFSLAVSARPMHVTHQPGYGRKSRTSCSQERQNRPHLLKAGGRKAGDFSKS